MTEPSTKRVQAKPFGHDKTKALMIRDEALRTMTRQECFDRGFITVKDLDDEELRAGMCRDANGLVPYNHKHTRLLPSDQYDAMVQEHELRFKQKLRQNLDDMLEIMIGIAKDETVEPRDRFESAKYLFERTAGKTAETVHVTVKQEPYEELLSGITGIGSISRAEHRRLSEQGPGSGIIDVEVIDEDDVQSDDLQEDGEYPAEPDVVPVYQPRPDEQPEPTRDAPTPQRPLVRKDPNGPEPTFERDPAKPSVGPAAWATVQVDTPDPVTQYGSKRTEAKSYGDQVREAQNLAERRKESKAKIKDAVKQRKIARATGADAITTDITGATVDEHGNLTFE